MLLIFSPVASYLAKVYLVFTFFRIQFLWKSRNFHEKSNYLNRWSLNIWLLTVKNLVQYSELYYCWNFRNLKKTCGAVWRADYHKSKSLLTGSNRKRDRVFCDRSYNECSVSKGITLMGRPHIHHAVPITTSYFFLFLLCLLVLSSLLFDQTIFLHNVLWVFVEVPIFTYSKNKNDQCALFVRRIQASWVSWKSWIGNDTSGQKF